MNAALFGRYVDRPSAVHRLDPRTKLCLTLVLMMALLLGSSWIALAVGAMALIAFYALARLTPLAALRSIAPLFFIVIITALLNIFFVQGGAVYLSWGAIQISQAGVESALFMAARLTLLLAEVSLLSLTTTNLDITEAFERLLKPFSRIGLPAHELAMMMGLALRFLPQFAVELQTIYRAQASRGAHLSLWPPAAGARGLTALLVPLFASAFRHADTLSEAMEARCYHGASGRTRLHPLAFRRRDAIACVVVAGVSAAIIAADWIF